MFFWVQSNYTYRTCTVPNFLCGSLCVSLWFSVKWYYTELHGEVTELHRECDCKNSHSHFLFIQKIVLSESMTFSFAMILNNTSNSLTNASS